MTDKERVLRKLADGISYSVDVSREERYVTVRISPKNGGSIAKTFMSSPEAEVSMFKRAISYTNKLWLESEWEKLDALSNV